MKSFYLLTILFFFLLLSCHQRKDIAVDKTDYYNALDQLTEVMIHDIFSPPVASRIYAYPSIAAYEVMQNNKSNKMVSMSEFIEHYPDSPIPDNPEFINFEMASVMAYLDVSQELVFSTQRITNYKDSLYKLWSDSPKFQNSLDYAKKISNHILAWSKKDNYAETRSMPKFSTDDNDLSRWKPTPPDYMDGIEPHWNKIRPFLLVSASQFKPQAPTPFSLDKKSQFYKELIEVYSTVNDIRKEGDSSEKLEIAQFWDCNPYVSTHQGHMMYATKKITPGAHWILINKITSNQAHLDYADMTKSFAMLCIGVHDAFISSWDEKYRSNLTRPETLINLNIDEDWTPILQTPPFPEHTSGHSVVSGAASVILTEIYGDDFKFDDTTEIPFGLPVRSFNSFEEAANEAAISRLYGGIHYMPAIEDGLTQGRNIGAFISKQLNL